MSDVDRYDSHTPWQLAPPLLGPAAPYAGAASTPPAVAATSATTATFAFRRLITALPDRTGASMEEDGLSSFLVMVWIRMTCSFVVVGCQRWPQCPEIRG